MKTLVTVIALWLLADSAYSPEPPYIPDISYFKYQSAVQAKEDGQHYIVVDEAIWQHARADLGDLRLVAGDKEVPFALSIERGSEQREHKDVPVLQESAVQGKTQFLIDMSQIGEYSRVELRVGTKNYVAHAEVEGQDDPHGKKWAILGDGILYDLSTENLGSNSVLRLPVSRYKFLRVTLDGPVQPKDVQGAFTELGEGRSPLYRTVASATRQERRGKDTLYFFEFSGSVPIERIVFTIDPAQPNFRRSVEIEDDKSGWLGSGEISRVHMLRNARKIDSEVSDVCVSTRGHNKIQVIIHNGDDPPLQIASASLQQYQRRVYFDLRAQGQLTLYYGDEKLEPPIFDYAKLFQQDKGAVAATLGPEIANVAYKGRPDDRPWSERHPAVLWGAIVAAVMILGTVALRSIKST
jgi:hypothetical protein